MLRYLRNLDPDEEVDVYEISARLRIGLSAVNNITYQENTTFPRPVTGRGKCRIWVWQDVLDWYLAHRILRGDAGSHIPKKENRYRNQSRVYRRAS